MSFTLRAHRRKNGTYEAKGIDPITRRRKSYYSQNEQEAIAKAVASYNTDDNTVAWFYENVFLPTIVGTSYNYRLQVKWAFDRYLFPAIGNVTIGDVDRKMLQKAFNSFKKARKPHPPLEASSLSRIRSVCHSIFKLAEDDGIVDRNPAKGIRLPKHKPKKPAAIGAKDLLALYDASDRLRPFILLTGFAGMRQGEALGASYTSIKGDTLSVEQQVQKQAGKNVLSKKLKTDNSYRDIPLPFMKELGKKRIWVCEDDGGFMTPSNSDFLLRKLCKDLGLPIVGPHALRHAFIEIMENDLEAPRRVVQALVGHAGKEITDGYSRVSMEVKRRWMQKFWEHVTTTVRQEAVVFEAAGNLN